MRGSGVGRGRLDVTSSRRSARKLALERDGAPVYVADTGARVVGMVTLCVFRTLTGPKAFLDHLVVDPGFRRRGIGRALLEHAVERAAAAGASRIDLTANDSKQTGHSLYRPLGFRARDTRSFRLYLYGGKDRSMGKTIMGAIVYLDGFMADDDDTGGLEEPLLLENPSTIAQGDRVTHLVYDVSR